MKTMAFITIGLLFISFGNAQSPSDCTSENVQTCVANMERFKLDEYDAIVPTWTESDLHELCSEYKKTDLCIDALIGQCHAYDQYYYKAVEDSWDYICQDKKTEYLDIRQCLATQSLHDKADDRCTRTWEQRVKDLDHSRFRNAQGVLNDDGLSSLCNAATEYLNCVYTEVELVCGKEAALWQEGFDDTLIQPILKLVGCQLETKNGRITYVYPESGGLSQTVIIIVAISISLGVLVMVVIAILLLRQNRRNNRRDPPQGEVGPYVMYDPGMGAVAGPMAGPPMPPSYKEKGDLGPEFGIPMPPPPQNVYEPPPSYKPPASVYNDGRSVASGHTTRTHHSHHTTASHAPSAHVM